MPMWNPQAESMPRQELEKLQLERLKDAVARAAANVPFYKKKFAEAGVSADSIKSLDDLRKFPFTVKDDLRDNYPYGLFAVPLEQIVRLHATSGTTGRPVVGGYTRKDIAIWAEVMARTLTAASVTSKDIVHNAYGYGLFTGGLGFHLGAEAIGAAVVPMSGGLTKRQVMLMEDFGATVLACTPSYALVLAEEAAESGHDIPHHMKLRVGLFGAEPWTEKMRDEIEGKLGLEAYDIYGLMEIIGPGVSVECEHHNGTHINEDHFLVEMINPDTGERVEYDEIGEIVFTTLTKEGMPLIRYRTRDRTVLHGEKCACGRTLARMEKIMGRTDDMLIVRGVNVFPSAIERTLLSISDIEPQYQIIIDRPKDQLDHLEIWVEASPRLFQPIDTRQLDTLAARLAQELLQTVGVSCEVKLMGPKTITRFEGKAKRVVDKREL
jgi:phenylacetate-CoA ligase